MKKIKTDLTIISVSFNSKKFLKLNQITTNKLNQKIDYKWLIVENSSANFHSVITERDRGFTLVRKKKYPKKYSWQGSYQHSYAINQALEKVKSRYVLIMDPDFYMISPFWIPKIITYMNENNLTFFGAPYHPARFTKYRYFPCAICMFIDLHNVNRKSLNFTPEISFNKAKSKNYKFNKKNYKIINLIKKHKSIYNISLYLLNSLTTTFLRNKFIASSKDTGIKLFKKFSQNEKYKYSYLNPVFKNGYNKRGIIERIARPLLPENWCYIPKRNNYFLESGFIDRNLPDLNGLGWEEYFFNGEPFGFHVRGLSQGLKEVNIQEISSIIKQFSLKQNV